ncbi:MAG: type II toxin-antitoxin system Phd/YefM family antitoxin [Solirubrobacteraceae bacterium]
MADEIVPLNEAKTRFSEMVRRVQAGEEIVIRRTPVARLIAEHPTAIRPPGALRGRVRIAEDFDAPLADFNAYFPPAG